MFNPPSRPARLIGTLVVGSLVASVAATTLAALAQQDPLPPPAQVPPAEPGAEPTGQLRGPTWQWQRSEYSDDTTVVVRDPSRYTVEFLGDGRLTIRADCNRALGRYARNGPMLTVELGPTTLVGCPPDSQADAFLRDLAAAATHVFDGENLVVNMKLDTGNMVFAPVGRPALPDSSWELRSYNNGRGAVVSVLPPPLATATFGADGRLHGSAGCNTYRGSYTLSGESLTIGPLATTRMACEPPIMGQEQAFLQALATASRYEFDGRLLVLRDASGATQAVLAPAGAVST